MNTFIANSNGEKVGFFKGRSDIRDLAIGLTAKYCDCDENTTDTSEIIDWATAEELGNLPALKLAYKTARNALSPTERAYANALEDILKYILKDMRD